MLEWNALIKPLVYVIELILAAVVTIGTADKLLFQRDIDETLRCALGDNIGACSSVIILGALCMFGGFYVLWKRLSSVFLCDMKYRNDTESVMCLTLSIGWLVIACVVTAFRSVPDGLTGGFLRQERRVTISLAWILWVLHIASMAIAWFAPDQDDGEELEGINLQRFPDDTFESTAHAQALGNLLVPESMEQTSVPVTPQEPSYRAIFDRDEFEHGSGHDSGRHDTIQDAALQWKDIVQAELDPDLDISGPPSILRQPSASPNISGQSNPFHQSVLRRRNVRFPENDLHGE